MRDNFKSDRKVLRKEHTKSEATLKPARSNYSYASPNSHVYRSPVLPKEYIKSQPSYL